MSKMLVLTNLLVCVSIFGFIAAAKLPSYIKACSRSDPDFIECCIKTSNELIPKLAGGDKLLHVPSLTPLIIPKMYLEFGNDLTLDMLNCSLYGLENTTVTKLIPDFDNQSAAFELFVPRLQFEGQYDISGRIFFLPIVGQGPSNITYVDGVYSLRTYFNMTDKKGKEYAVPDHTTLTYTTKRAYFQLDNLFGGEPTLGEQMNKFLNENWKEVNDELGAKIGDAFGEVFNHIITGVFSRIPYEELFPL